MEKKKKVLINIRHLDVKFHVRARILTAIRDVSLEIYEGENLAIVGESGSGKSVLTKTFTGMLESNGIISHGKILYANKDLEDSNVHVDHIDVYFYEHLKKSFLATVADLNNIQKKLVIQVDSDVELARKALKDAENNAAKINAKAANASNKKKADLVGYALQADAAVKKAKEHLEYSIKHVAEAKHEVVTKAAEQKALCTEERINHLCVDLMCSIDRFPFFQKYLAFMKFKKIFINAIRTNVLLTDKRMEKLTAKVTFVVTPIDKLEKPVVGQNIKAKCSVDLAKIKLNKDWQQVRGVRIATVFQDPMTSLNPIRSIGSQITEVIIKHQHKTKEQAHNEAVSLMEKVGIYDAEARFNDYPFEYSGGMRQRIVIAIALACRPQILICDEPTTALDVTIQAQIIDLIKNLQKEYGFTTIYITHDLGVVASVADRVAVLYAGQIVEYGTVEEIYYEPKHPYTWALLSSLPQLSEKGTELFSIKGTPPSLYNEIKGDAFAPRNPYALHIDFEQEAPMFQVSPTHFAKTWLLDPRAPKIEPPTIIHNLHKKMAAKANWDEVISNGK